MRFATTLIVAASIGIAASVVAPNAKAGVVIGVSLPLPVIGPVIATVPSPAVYVNPAIGFYAPGYYYVGYRGCYGCRYGYGYRGYVHPDYHRSVAVAHRR